MIYCYPKLSEYDFVFFRAIGPGLGNLLFPWARAVVHAHINGYQLIAPTWPQLKVGTILRKELDSRMYWGLFNSNSDSPQKLQRLKKLLTLKHIDESNSLKVIDNQIIRFSGMRNLFTPILGHNNLVNSKLLEIIRPEHLKALNHDFKNSISIHIRLGDFAAASIIQSAGTTNTRIPIQWYIDSLKAIRTQHGENTKANIFSDGTDDELREILRLPNVNRISFGSAAADLIGLSRAEKLIASGSTFSMWASYLGEMPTIWYPGQLKQKLHENNEVEFDPKRESVIKWNL